MLGVDDDEHAVRREGALERGGDVLAEALLQLRPGGDRLDDAGDAAEAGQALGGQVGDVRDAREGQQVVLAHGAQGDVAQQHDLAALTRV